MQGPQGGVRPPSGLEFVEPEGLATPVGPYSHGTRVGQLLFCSGQLALDPGDSHTLADLSVAAQTRIVLENVAATVAAAGSSMKHVARTTVYLVSLDDYGEMNEVYREFFPGPKPARATLAVAGLIGGLRVEIDAIAVVP